MKTVDHKCPNCNASLNYNPKGKNWVCEYCGGKFSLEDLKENEKNFEKTDIKDSKELKEDKKTSKTDEKNKEKIKENESVEMDEYYCEDCGAKIVADKNTAATFCVYCKNTAILKSRLSDKFSPSKIIPFAKTKEDAIEAFKNIGKNKFLMPKEFSDSKNIQELTGVYIPFWLYTCKIDGHVNGKATRVITWADYDYFYTKTDTYNVVREGNYTFQNIPVDGSVRFNDAIMNSIEPFNYDELIDFNYSYLSGFLAEKYDIQKEEAKKITINRAFQSTKTDLLQKASSGNFKYATFIPDNNECKITEENIDYVLLPVWMVNIKYNEQIYTFAMNGQTGKMVGDIPYSKKKAFIFWLLLFVVIFLVMLLITYLI